MPLESDINIAVNGHFWVEVANPEHPFTAMSISRSRGTWLHASLFKNQVIICMEIASCLQDSVALQVQLERVAQGRLHPDPERDQRRLCPESAHKAEVGLLQRQIW